MSVPLRRFSIVMMVVLSVAACKRRKETQGAPSEPAAATAAAPAPTPAPDVAHDAAAAAPWVTRPRCDADGDLDATTGVPCLYTWDTPAGPTPLVIHVDELGELRLVAEVDGARSVVVHLADTNIAGGTRLHLRRQPEQRLAVVLIEDWSEEGNEPETAEAWLLSRTGKTVEVTTLDKDAEPRPAWASATADPAAMAALPATAPTPRPRPLAGCATGLTSPEQACACAAKILRKGDEAAGEHCTVHETETGSARIGEVSPVDPEEPSTYFVMHRVGTGWAALFILGAPSTGGAITTEYEVAAARTKTFGSRQALWIEVDDKQIDVEETENIKAQVTRRLTLCLVSEAGEPTCVLEVPLSGEERSGKLPAEIWGTPEQPIDHVDKLRVVSSYRLRVEVSDDGKASVAPAKGELPEDVHPLIGTHTLW